MPDVVSSRWRTIASTWWGPLILIVAALAMTLTVTTSHGRAFSPIDEWIHFDSMTKVPHEVVVRQGEFIGQETLKRLSCDGVFPYGPLGPACGGDYTDYKDYPLTGITSGDAYTPIFFVFTWVGAKAIQLIRGGTDLLLAARLTGALWLIGGLLVFWRLARELGLPKLVTLAVGIAFIASDYTRWTYTYISTDSPSFLFGAGAVLLAVWFIKKKASGWWLVPFSIFIVLTKITNILAVGLAVLILLVYTLLEWRARRRGEAPSDGPPLLKVLLVAGVSVVSAIAAEGIWLAIRTAIAVGPPPYGSVLVSGRIPRPTELAQQVLLFIPNTILQPFDLGLGYTIPAPLFEPLSWLCIAGVIGFAFYRTQSRLDRSLSSSILTAGLVFAPILALAMTFIGGISFALPTRYGGMLLPAFLIAVAFVCRGRISSWLVLGYAVVVLIVVLNTAHLYIH